MNYVLLKNDPALTFAELWALDRICFSEPLGEGQFADFLQGDFWTARVAGELAGFAAASARGGGMHLNRIEVGEAYRRAGIGAALIERALELAALMSVPHVTLTVRANNEGARRLYEKKGFAPIGEMSRFAIPVANLPDAAAAEVRATGEGRNAPVSFYVLGRQVGSGKFNAELGGCKDLLLEQPERDLPAILAGLRGLLRPGSEFLYAMSGEEACIAALRALPLARETCMIDMQRAM